MVERVELNLAEQEEVVGGRLIVGNTYTTRVAKNFLALRSLPQSGEKVEFGSLFNGSQVKVLGEAIGDYVPVMVTYQAPGKCDGSYSTNVTNMLGYVNQNYLY